MLSTGAAAALARPPALLRCSASARAAPGAPQAARVCATLAARSPAARRSAPRRRAAPPLVRARNKDEEEGVSAAGADLAWSHVASDVKRRLAGVVAGHDSTAGALQSWLSQARLEHSGETDVDDKGQAEMVAEVESDFQRLQELSLDVRSWVDSPESPEHDGRVVGLLVVRALQAYRQGTGEPFDDEADDAYWRLQGFLPGELVSALDHATLQRLIKAYMSLPFSGA